VSLQMLLAEGMVNVYARHAAVAAYCRERLHAMNVRLFPVRDEISSPTVTAAYVPDGWRWQDFDQALRARGVVVGGNYGTLAGKVFRVGHMGSQADMDLVRRGMDALEEIIG
jgi:aspartate aminotransferase-like enzyme